MSIFLHRAGLMSDTKLTSITAFNSSTSFDSSTLTLPASIQAGDLIVFSDRAVNTSGIPTTAVPSNFTSIDNISLTNARAILSYKLATGGEGGTSITGMSGTSTSSKLCYVFRGNKPATTITVSTPNSQITDGNPTAQSVNASGGVAPLVIIGAYSVWSAQINPRTFTVAGSPAKDGEITDATDHYLAYKIYNSSPQNASIDMDDEEDRNALQSCWIEMAA